jgi:hypothetical protein
VGSVLSCTSGTANGYPAPTYPTYTWIKSSGATTVQTGSSSTYTLISTDSGSTITCQVTATNSSGSTTATSAATSVVTTPSGTIPAVIISPSLISTSYVETILECNVGTYTGSPTGYWYQWQESSDSGSTWSNKTNQIVRAYTPVTADITKLIRCGVTPYNITGIGTIAYSNATSAVIAAPTLVPPELTWVSANTVRTPEFDARCTEALAGDIFTLEWATNSIFTTGTGSFARTIRLYQESTHQPSMVVSSFSAGTYYFRLTHARGAFTSGVSNTVAVALV